MKKIFLLLCLAMGLHVHAQQMAGYWYGTANIAIEGSTNNYLVELIVKQGNNNSVQGILNYYFRNTFRSVKLNGSYNAVSRQLEIRNIPVPYHGATDATQTVDCMMDFTATHRIAKAGSNLLGRFSSREAYRYTCPDLIFDLRLNMDAKNEDSILTALRNFKETYQVWSPTAADTLVAATIIDRPVVNYVVANQYKVREKEVVEDITIDADSVKVDFYDNGDIDGDSISVFVNDRLIAFNRILSTRSVQFTVALDTTREYTDITMFADNLGSIPPNTALMLVSDGTRRYELRLSSNLQKSASVRIRRKKN